MQCKLFRVPTRPLHYLSQRSKGLFVLHNFYFQTTTVRYDDNGALSGNVG